MLPNSDHLVHGIASSAKTLGFDSFCNCVLTAIYSLAAYVCAYKRQSYDIQNQDRYKRTCHREAYPHKFTLTQSNKQDIL
jgi:hypothetical protein